ncbi:MAG: penicillin-binding protein 2 [Streptococcaceae bacterium]|jgi:penicillin-binding protein 2B|nr:penicillin-binding protein 2 [Streptococcaceae bacterium]
MPRSEKSKKSKEKKPQAAPEKIIGRRLTVLFAVVFALFLVLLGKLYFMQVMDKKYYATKLEESGLTVTVKQASPRGQIFDAKGLPLATTSQMPAVSFTHTEKITAAQMRANAGVLMPILRQFIDASQLTTRDKKDFYLSDLTKLAAVVARIPSAKFYDKSGRKLTGSATYELEVSYVKDSDISKMSADELLEAQLFKQMNATQLYSTSSIVTGALTAEQQAQIAQQESKLPGISIGTAWDHTLNTTSLLTPLIGTISTSKAGLPAEEADSLLAKGYLRNDRVGTSFLEKGYESTLQGTHSETQIQVDSKGDIQKEVTLQKGASGNNLKLTIDSAFENGVQQILQKNFDTLMTQGYGQFSQGAYAVVMNNKTGAILAMNGLVRDPATGKVQANAAATFQNAYTPGSVVKMGTITAGWQTGVITGNATQDAQAIQLRGSAPILDWWQDASPMPITVEQALEFSSNTYQVQLALKMLGAPYQTNMIVPTDKRVQVYNALRKAYGQYGLGVATGLDIPGEISGLIPATSGDNADIPNLLFESFGQFDNYTPLQLATYAATMANGGTRPTPHVVSGIYDTSATGGLGNEIKPVSADPAGKVDISSENMGYLKQGMYNVVHGTGGMATGTTMANSSVSISAKTGTSQTYAYSGGKQIPTTVNNAIAFAPSGNPQISVGVMVPTTTIQGTNTTHANQQIVVDIVNLYNQMYHFK